MANDSEFGSRTRERVLHTAVVLIAALFIARLAYLQILQSDIYRSKAEEQAIKEKVIEPFRGDMFDRHGQIMVKNSPSFSVLLTPNDFREESIPLLASIIKMDPKEIRKNIEQAKKSVSRFQPIKIFRDADFTTIAAIEENHDYLPGVEISVESKRIYDFKGNGAHLFGYAREISESQLKQMGDYYKPGDVVGISGLEAAYETLLRGKKGSEFYAVNVLGQRVASFNDGKNDIQAASGFDLYLGIDKRLQEIAENLMEGKRGAVVAIDPNNGEVLALTGKPDFDLRLFAGRTPPQLYSSLARDEGKPLFNRATMTQYPPGSTWKMLTGIAAMHEGLITEKTTIYCPGAFSYGGRSWGCHGSHGSIALQRAIQASCNTFFCSLGPRLGMENITKWGRLFGFGQRTGIDLTEEGRGNMPSAEWMDKVYGKNGWGPGRLVNLAFGQGELGVTPLQMAAYTAALANRGTYYQPHVVRAYFNKITGKIEPIEYGSRRIEIKPHIWDVTHAGMYDVVNKPGGTAGRAKVPGINVSGKTGTAENPHGEDHAWFVCFAPSEKPTIAMCVMVENSGFGGTIAAPIAQKILEAYFYPDRGAVLLDSLQNIKNGIPMQQVNTRPQGPNSRQNQQAALRRD
ncbi:MAG TPA: penicillin-binding protein 2 [Patescibacteria group bacterium]|nr:penicillin-binding protein 2 [Patescibacteria group bacterium]